MTGGGLHAATTAGVDRTRHRRGALLLNQEL
jgi:hypothetical protein